MSTSGTPASAGSNPMGTSRSGGSNSPFLGWHERGYLPHFDCALRHSIRHLHAPRFLSRHPPPRMGGHPERARAIAAPPQAGARGSRSWGVLATPRRPRDNHRSKPVRTPIFRLTVSGAAVCWAIGLGVKGISCWSRETKRINWVADFQRGLMTLNSGRTGSINGWHVTMCCLWPPNERSVPHSRQNMVKI